MGFRAASCGVLLYLYLGVKLQMSVANVRSFVRLVEGDAQDRFNMQRNGQSDIASPEFLLLIPSQSIGRLPAATHHTSREGCRERPPRELVITQPPPRHSLPAVQGRSTGQARTMAEKKGE